MKEKIEKRIQEIEASIQQVVAQHSQLMGHLNEAKFLLQTIFNEECKSLVNSTETMIEGDKENAVS